VASNYVDIPIEADVAQWYGSDSDVIYLNAEAEPTDATTARNKIDVFAASDDPGGDIEVYALCAWQLYG